MKIKQILIFAIAILLSTYAFFKFISFKKNHLSLNSHLTNNSQNIVFKVQSEFSKYSIKDNSIDEELFNNIVDELKLNTQGWCQFNTFDLVYPNKVEFIFADINLLNEQEQQQLLNKNINNDKQFIAGIKSNFNQTTKTLTYTLHIDRAFPDNNPNFSSIATYWSRKIVHMLCSCNNTLNKNNKINSKYQDIVEQFNLEFQSLFKINNNQTSFFHSLLQKFNIVQPVFADCSGKWECAPKLNHWVCEDNYSEECNENIIDDCGLGIECINRYTCATNDSSFYNCNGTTLDACYSESCPTGFCDPYQSTCSWDPGAPPVIPPACGDGWCDVEGATAGVVEGDEEKPRTPRHKCQGAP